MSSSPDVVRIVEIIDALDDEDVLTRTELAEWLRTDDANVVGALVHLWERRGSDFSPSFDSLEVFDLLLKNFRVSLAADASDAKVSRFAFTPSEAGRALSAWAISHMSPADLTSLSDTLADQYRNGNQFVRRVIVESVLEHLMERGDVSQVFAHWQDDESVRGAYEEAMQWATDHRR